MRLGVGAGVELQGLLRDIPPQVPLPTGVELAIDIDPMSLL